jgi:acetylxylan esterase
VTKEIGSHGEFDDLSNDLTDELVVAVLLFGDPRHSGNTTFNRGTSDHDGVSWYCSSTPC